MAPPTCSAGSWSRPRPRWPSSTPRRSARPRPSSRATAWPRRPWSWPCSTPGCDPGRAAGRLAGRDPRPGPGRVSVGIMDSVPELLDAVARLPRPELPPDQAEVEPGWDLESGRRSTSASATRSCSRSTPTPPTPSPTPATWPGWTGSGCCCSSSRWTRTTSSATPSSPGGWRPRSASTSRSPRPRAVDAVGSAPAGSSTSRPAASAATWRPSACTTPARRSACPCGAAGCWSGPRSRRQRRPGRPARLHPVRRHLGLRPLLPPGPAAPFVLSTATSRSPPAPGSGSSPSAEILEALTTSVECVPA